MVTMSVINGHAFAGGLMLALAHDFRIMTTSPKVALCLAEINLGIPVPPALNTFIRTLTTPNTARLMHLGTIFDSNQALKLGLITD